MPICELDNGTYGTVVMIMYRVFTFGIGSGASTALVKGLAKAGNGTAEFIKEGERLQPKVISPFSTVITCVYHMTI